RREGSEVVERYFINYYQLCEQADPDGPFVQHSDYAALEAENARLRGVISKSATALGNGAHIDPRCSVEFMEGLPKEISLVVARTEASAAVKADQDVIATIIYEAMVWASQLP